jgi:hypothetical protein
MLQKKKKFKFTFTKNIQIHLTHNQAIISFPDSSSKVTKKEYRKKIMLLLKTMLIVGDQIVDIIFFIMLLERTEYFFGAVYLTVDLLPATIIMWQKFPTESIWTVLVLLISLHIMVKKVRLG